MYKQLFCLLGLLGLISSAQEVTQDSISDRNSLPEVLISSTPVADQLKRIPVSVNLISANDLQRGDQLSIANEINKNPGIEMQQGALNTSRITIRGVGARSQYSTNRVKAYVEGIPLTTGEGETTLDDIDLNLIERVEIIKGPASSSYGGGLGGAINISIAKPEYNTKALELNTSTGSYGLFKGGATASLASEKTAGLLSYNHLEKDGFRTNSNYNRNTYTAYAKTELNDAMSLTFFGNYTRLKAFIASSINEEDFKNNPEKAAFTWGQAKGYESYDKAIAGLSYAWNLDENSTWNTSVFTNYRDGYEPRPFDILDEESFAFGIRSNLQSSFSFFKIPVKSSIGIEYFDENYKVHIYDNLYESNNGNGSLQGDALSSQEQDRKYLNLFAQINFQFTERLKAELGLSYNHSRYILNDGFNESGEDQSGTYTYPRQFLPHAGISYEVVREKFLYASVSRGFSLPSVAETLTPEGAINTAIKPETGVNYEVGLKANWLGNKLYTELAFYTIQVDNLLVAQRIAEDQYVGLNAGKTNHDGLEFLAKYNQQLTATWSLNPYGSLTLNNYKFEEFVNNDIDYKGNDLTGVPDNIVNLGIDLVNTNGLSFSTNFRHVGMIPLNDANELYSKSYELVNLRGDYSFNLFDGLASTAYAGINNLFNTNYASQILPNATGFGGALPRFYYPGEPINFYIGVKFDVGL
ncbi:MAG: TonB-dependent receptor [Leeuwenhoekiella sp.]